MRTSSLFAATLVFFWSVGWICAGSAIGEGAESKAAEAPAPSDPEALDLFSDESLDGDDGLDAGEVPDVSFDDESKIDLAIDDQDIIKVLQMLAIQSQRNILPSSSVSGNVSAALYQVDFFEALDALLHTNGFGYVEEGNFIRIYTTDELIQMQQSKRKPEVRVVRLNYLTAKDAAEFVQPMLSEGVGSIGVSAEAPKGIVATTSAVGENSWAYPDTLVIRDYPDVIEEIVDVLSVLDEQPPQVQIEVTILEARLNEDNAYGVDLSVLIDYDAAIFKDPLGVVDTIISGDMAATGSEGGAGGTNESFKNAFGTGAAAQSLVGNTASGKAGVKFGILTDHVSAFVRALDSVTDTTVLARPKVLTLNRQAAELISGEKLGYISTVQTETSTTQTVEFLDVGTQLTVRPFVSGDGFIRLEIRPKISEGDVRIVDGLVIPDESTNEVIANIIVPNGKTVVLGGLFKEDTTVSRAQVPGLANLPGVGRAFQGHDDMVLRSEVIFLIRPTIVKHAALTKWGQAAADDVERARIGARNGLLPWSRSVKTAAHMRNANSYLEQGDKDRALFAAKMALELNPTLVEAMRMKAELNGEHIYWPDSGIISRTVDRMVEEQLKSGGWEGSIKRPAIDENDPKQQVRQDETTEVDDVAQTDVE